MTTISSDAAATPARCRVRYLTVALIVAGLALALALQGWRSRLPLEWLAYIDGAHALLSQGQLPDHGHATSYRSFAPPGGAWLMTPGVWLFADPRLSGIPGGALLHVGTLIGVFLLARACFGVPVASLAVVMYAVAMQGMHEVVEFPYEGQFFYVWMTYWTCWWIARRDARYLAAAVLTWAVGIYVTLQWASAIVMLPAVWVLYRPPVRLRPLIAVGALALLIWFPYLRFEANRAFADVRSQVLLQPVEPAIVAIPGCTPVATLREWAASPPESRIAVAPDARSPGGRVLVGAGRRLEAMARGVLQNFKGLVPGADLPLAAMTLAGLWAIHIRRRFSLDRGEVAGAGGLRGWPTVLAIGLLIWSGLANPTLVARMLYTLRPADPAGLNPLTMSTIRTMQAIAALGAVALLMRRPIARGIRTMARGFRPTACDPEVLAIALVVPWVLLLLISEVARWDRVWGLWPLQAIVLAYFVTAACSLMGTRYRLVRWLGPLLVVGSLAANDLVRSHAQDWWRAGWSGSDPVEAQVADDLARRIHGEGRDRAVIGYQQFFLGVPPIPTLPTERAVGDAFDGMLQYRHGITNARTCWEGLSTEDEYRVVETDPQDPAATDVLHVPTSGPSRFLVRIGRYEVYKIDRGR